VILVLLISSGQEPATSIPQKPQKRTLVIYELDRMHPAHVLTEKGILSVVATGSVFDIQIYAEYMDSTRFQ
jgi:hypothetical protein